jgi:hypothetical protein
VRLRLRDGEVDGAVVRRAAGTAALTPREQAVLEWLAARRDRAVTRDELLIEVFGMSPDARSRAVDVIARRLREKLEVDPERPEHVLTVFGTGYRFVESPAPALPPDPGFVGRKDEVERLATALSGPVTAVVVGPPGASARRGSSRGWSPGSPTRGGWTSPGRGRRGGCGRRWRGGGAPSSRSRGPSGWWGRWRRRPARWWCSTTRRARRTRWRR